MVIDTTSREGMESSLAHLMGVSVPELYQYIEAAADSAVEGQWCFNQDLFDKAMEDFYSDMIEQELPDEILFFHLSRRLMLRKNVKELFVFLYKRENVFDERSCIMGLRRVTQPRFSFCSAFMRARSHV